MSKIFRIPALLLALFAFGCDEVDDGPTDDRDETPPPTDIAGPDDEEEEDTTSGGEEEDPCDILGNLPPVGSEDDFNACP